MASQPPVSSIDSTTCVYAWHASMSPASSLYNRIAVPQGYERVPVTEGTFAHWLRYLPLKQNGSLVYLHDGRRKFNQSAHFAVVDIDTGDKDLQQCADAVMRLRAEYLFAGKRTDDISFNFTNGFPCDFRSWSQGKRPKVNGNKVWWEDRTQPDKSYSSFKKYLQTVFMYAGTHSLERSLKRKPVSEISAGDVFIQGGFPGHAVLVMDVAVNKANNEKIFLLAQSYMPAQDIHILVNPSSASLSPWYSVDFQETLITPEWTFKKSDLKSFD